VDPLAVADWASEKKAGVWLGGFPATSTTAAGEASDGIAAVLAAMSSAAVLSSCDPPLPAALSSSPSPCCDPSLPASVKSLQDESAPAMLALVFFASAPPPPDFDFRFLFLFLDESFFGSSSTSEAVHLEHRKYEPFLCFLLKNFDEAQHIWNTSLHLLPAQETIEPPPRFLQTAHSTPLGSADPLSNKLLISELSTVKDVEKGLRSTSSICAHKRAFALEFPT
jgi:hypothetical protein